jgi:hypothetical protein
MVAAVVVEQRIVEETRGMRFTASVEFAFATVSSDG